MTTGLNDLIARRKKAQSVAEPISPTSTMDDDSLFAARVLDPSCADDASTIESLLQTQDSLIIYDTLSSQLRELIEIRNPSVRTEQELAKIQEGFLQSHQVRSLWVHYPWKNALVHVLPREEFQEIRRNRNAYLITADEAALLARKSISILGLSVGAATAVTMAMEGLAGTFHLADFDELSLSNTNRIRSSVIDIGESKTTLCARAMLEIDPFLIIKVFPRGLSKDNIAQFLDGVDLFVELCDDIYMKLLSREHARERQIPTLMETSLKGMLDVERFDLEPERLPLHGLLKGISADLIQSMPTSAKIKYLLPVVGGIGALSARMAASLVEQNQTLCSWPQLASAIQLGSGIASDTSRRILLSQKICSGRYLIDLERLVPAEKQAATDAEQQQATPDCKLRTNDSMMVDPILPVTRKQLSRFACYQADYSTGTLLSAAHKKKVLEAAECAPSGGNTQPWSFHWLADTLICQSAAQNTWSTLDHLGKAVEVALGAAVENIKLQSLLLGFVCTTSFERENDGRIEIASNFLRATPEQEVNQLSHELELASRIQSRRTNRSDHSLKLKIPMSDLDTIQLEAESQGASIAWITKTDMINRLQRLLGRMDRLCLLHEKMHDELVSEIFDPRTLTETPTSGISIDDLGLSEAAKIGFKVTKDSGVSNLLRKVGGGAALINACVEKRTNAYGLLYQERSQHTYYSGGQSMQRMWLQATSKGLSIHPWSGCLYIFARIESGGEDIFSREELHEIQDIRSEFLNIFPRKIGGSEILLFRIGYASHPDGQMIRRGLAK